MNCKDQEVVDEIDQDDLFYDFYQDYEAELHKSNAVDFGGLITGVINLFENFPEVLERYQKRYHYILVDEYQDTNRAQFKLIKMISSLKKNICVVGDEDQSIYSWRGADIRNILEFEKIFPKSRMIKLEQNYRSSKNIIEAASCVISKNEQRKGKEMWTDNDRGDHIDIVECPDDRVEAEFISSETRKLISDGVDPTEIAIFYRTNGQSRILEDALRKFKIAYRVVAGMKFYERKEVKDLLSYLRCVVNDKDSLALSRVINTPVRGIGAITLRKIEDEAIKNDASLWEMINFIVDDSEKYKFLRLSKKVKNGLRDFVGLIHEAKVLSDKKSLPSQIYEKILHESLYYETLEGEKTYEAQGRIENLDELMNGIKQYEETEEDPNLIGFLETITLDTSGSEEIDDEKQVSMMTIHGSKGLEYHYVFVAGCEETVFPSFQSMDDEQGLEEERRLFYVAMTRAMKKLYICFAEARMLWGSIRFNPPSRFIDEIPEDFYTWKSKKKKSAFNHDKLKSKKNGDFDFSDEFSQESSFDTEEIRYVTSPESIYKFPTNSKVEHKLYGLGTVLSAEGKGQDEKVVILFQGGAKKKFLVKFAPLTKVYDEKNI